MSNIRFLRVPAPPVIAYPPDTITPAERVSLAMPRLRSEPRSEVWAAGLAAFSFAAGALWMFLALGVWLPK